MSLNADIMRRFAPALACAMPFLLAAGRAPADVGASLLAVLFLLHSLRAREWAWLRLPEMRLLLLIWAYLICNAVFVTGMQREAMITALAWVRFPLCYASLRLWILKDERDYTLLCMCALTAAALSAVDAYWQYVTHISLTGHHTMGNLALGYRLTGPLPNANIGNLLLKLTLPAATQLACVALATGKRRLLWLALGVSIAVAVLVPLTGERTTTLLMLLGLATMGFTLAVRNPAMRRIVAAGVVAMLLVGAVVATQPVVEFRIWQTTEHLRHFHESPYGQIYIGAFRMWQEQPLFGIGLRQFFHRCQPLMEAHEVTLCDIHAHNIYLHWLAETGLVGFALFLVFCALCVRECWQGIRRARGNTAIGMAMSAGLLMILLWPIAVMQNMFSNWPGALFWFTLALAMIPLNRKST